MLTKKNPETAVWVSGCLALFLAGCSPNGNELLLRGDKQLREGKAAEAVRTLEQAAELMPDNARAWNHLGLAYHSAGNAPEARKAYARALQFDPNFPDPHYNLGTMEFELGRYAEAEAPLRTFLAWQPKRADAWAHLGQTQYQLRQFDAAERSLVATLQIDRTDPEVWNTLGLIQIQRKRYREAVQQFTEALRLSPGNAPARLNLAVTTHQYLGDRRTALQQYRDYLALQPEPPDVDAVRTVVRQLEVQLGLIPKTVPSTNSVSTPNVVSNAIFHAVTNPAPRVAFNLTNVAAAKPAPTNPPANPSAPTIARPTPTNLAVASLAPKAPAVAIPTNSVPAPTSAPPRAVAQLIPAVVTNRVAQTSPVAPAALLLPKPPVVLLKTNPPPASTTVRTSSPGAVVIAPSVTSAPPAKVSPPVVATNSIPVPNPPAEPPVKPTVVRVEEPPSFLPARDPGKATAPTPQPVVTPVAQAPKLPEPAAATPTTVPEPTPPPATTPTPTATSDSAQTPVSAEAESSDAAQKGGGKKSVLQRMNPVGWFKRDESPKAPEPKPAKETAGTGSKLNPVNWFRGKEKDPNAPSSAALVSTPPAKPAPQPPPELTRVELSTPTTPSFSTAQVAPEPAVVAPKTAPRPAPVRYAHTVTGAPKPGNRAAASTHFTSALAAHERRDYVSAMAEYQLATQSDPAYFEAQHNLAVTALNAGNLPVALGASESALALRPDSTTARWNYVIALQRSKYPADAVEELEKYVAVEKTNAKAHLMLAGLYALDLDEPERARTHYERLLELEPQHPQAENIRQWLAAHAKR